MPIRKARSGKSRHSGVQDTEKQTAPIVKDGAFYADASGNPTFKSPEAGEVDLGGDLPVTTLGTSGAQTIDRDTSDKFIIPEPTGAITLADSNFADMKEAIVDINNGDTDVSFPATWEWEGDIPALVIDGVDRLKLKHFLYGVTDKIFASIENLHRVFDPIHLNPFAWYDADAIEGLIDDDTVATWEDISANSYDATQSTESLKPLYKTSIINGKPVIRFDGTDDVLSIGSLDAFTELTVVVVYKNNSVAATFGGIIGTDGNSDGFQVVRQDSTQVLHMPGFAGHATPSSTILVSTPYIVSSIYTGASAAIWVNGVDKGSTANSGTVSAGTTYNIGRTNSASRTLNGDIAEILVFDYALSVSQREDLETYLNNKYNTF